jgi:hypothetical protein
VVSVTCQVTQGARGDLRICQYETIIIGIVLAPVGGEIAMRCLELLKQLMVKVIHIGGMFLGEWLQQNTTTVLGF